MLIILVILASILNSHSSMAQSQSIPSNEVVVASQYSPLEYVKRDKLIHSSPPALPLTEWFDDTVNRWIAQLAQQPEFADWQSPTLSWNRQPLGPGLHGWIVILSDKDQELGYLVVTVDPDGHYSLSEYGLGEYPLFSSKTLYRSLVEHELIEKTVTFEQFESDNHIIKERIYLNPLHSIWLITMDYDSFQLDAKTGELLDIDSSTLHQDIQQHSSDHNWAAPISDTHAIHQSIQLTPFDPYYNLSWIQKPPDTIKDLQQLQVTLDAKEYLTFVADLYHDTVVYAFSVTGYHQWNGGDPFITIDHEGARFIPAQQLMETGRWYVTPQEHN